MSNHDGLLIECMLSNMKPNTLHDRKANLKHYDFVSSRIWFL